MVEAKDGQLDRNCAEGVKRFCCQDRLNERLAVGNKNDVLSKTIQRHKTGCDVGGYDQNLYTD